MRKAQHLFTSWSSLSEIKVGKQGIVLCHYAMRVWPHHPGGTWQLYGHSHGNLPDDPLSLSMDVEWTPMSFSTSHQRMGNDRDDDAFGATTQRRIPRCVQQGLDFFSQEACGDCSPRNSGGSRRRSLTIWVASSRESRMERPTICLRQCHPHFFLYSECAALGSAPCALCLISSIDLNAKLALAKTLGADLTFNAKTCDPAAQLKKETGGGAHGVLITAPALTAFKQGIGMTRKRGTCVLVGLPPGDFRVPLFDVVANCITIRGSFVGTRKTSRRPSTLQ